MTKEQAAELLNNDIYCAFVNGAEIERAIPSPRGFRCKKVWKPVIDIDLEELLLNPQSYRVKMVYPEKLFAFYEKRRNALTFLSAFATKEDLDLFIQMKTAKDPSYKYEIKDYVLSE